MTFARLFSVAAGCVALGAAAAACSGSFGSGTGMPATMASPGFGGPSTPTPLPSAASVILTYGENTGFQQLTDVGGYGGAIAFPKAAEPTAVPSPKGKATPAPAPTAVSIAIGVTLSTVKPQDGPDLNFESGKGRKRKTREAPARALAYIVLLPTHDANLAAYPRIELDVPREIASQYRDGEFGLALWNSGEKDSKYRLAVAGLDTTSTPPPLAARPLGGAVTPAASPRISGSIAPTPAPTATARTGATPLPGSSANPGGTTTPTPAATLPPARLLFAGTATTLKLVANRPAVFALYALPHPSSSPATKAAAAGSAAPVTRTSGAPSSTAPAAESPAPKSSP
jgi:hypothetical protein